MMTMEEAAIKLREISGSYAPDCSLVATVKSVSESEATCVLVDEDGQEIYGVRLCPTTGANKSFLQIPALNSFVMAIRVEDSEDWMVVACDKVEKVKLTVGQSRLEITETDVLINGGNLGGLIKISELTSQLNAFVTVFNSHTHAVAGSAASPSPQQARTFNKTTIEDTKVKH
jgi:hypothetical protein